MPEREPRIIEGACPECTLRIVLRKRGSGFDEAPSETGAKCLRGPDPLRCQSFREALTALRPNRKARSVILLMRSKKGQSAFCRSVMDP
jgi:hypothetical protein